MVKASSKYNVTIKGISIRFTLILQTVSLLGSIRWVLHLHNVYQLVPTYQFFATLHLGGEFYIS